MTPRAGRRLRHGALILASLLSLAPFVWMLWASFKKPGFGAGLDVLGPATEVLGPYEPPPGGPFLRFHVYRPGAAQVSVAGPFTGWNPLPLAPRGGGHFSGDVVAERGIHEYRFVMDGSLWFPDPENPPPEGKENSVIVLRGAFGVNHAGVRDRTHWLRSGMLPLVRAPGAEGVRLVFEEPDPEGAPRSVTLMRGAPDGTRVPDDSVGSPRRAADFFTLPGGTPLPPGPYTLVIERSLLARLRALYTLENYEDVLTDESFPFPVFFWNSLVVAGLSALLTTLLCTLGGYAFATKEFPGKTWLFRGCLASMMVPGMIYMVPQYAVVTRLGWIDSYAAMVVPHLANVFGLLLMTNYVRSLPRSLFEAAEVDGASEPQILFHVLFPLATPAMATLFVLTFMGQWSNFLWQLIVNTPSSAYRTLPVGLSYFKGQYDLRIEAMMAAAAFSVIPVTVVFFFSQKKLIAGLAQGSVKE